MLYPLLLYHKICFLSDSLQAIYIDPGNLLSPSQQAIVSGFAWVMSQTMPDAEVPGQKPHKNEDEHFSNHAAFCHQLQKSPFTSLLPG